MPQQVTEAELTVLEYGRVDLQVFAVAGITGTSTNTAIYEAEILQELLGDALLDAQHTKELQAIDVQDVALLQNKALCAAARADLVYTDLTQSSSQVRPCPALPCLLC